MEPYIRPAERLIGLILNGSWKVIQKYEPPAGVIHYTSHCYLVQKDDQKGFLKAFDYSDLKKAGGREVQKKIERKFDREITMLKKCTQMNINCVIKLLAHDTLFFKPDDINERADYFILEYSDDGDVLACLIGGHLNDFKNGFKSLAHIFEGLNSLHLNGIMHLDLKAQNLLYFVKERLTKISDFGSARQFITEVDGDLLEDLNSIHTTRQYAPPECLYYDYWTLDWTLYRRKIDLYLVGNVIVKLFTNFSFTVLLKQEISEMFDWNKPENIRTGKFKQYLPHLVAGAAEVYVVIQRKLIEINNDCGTPLTTTNISDLMRIIAELCNPDPEKRGHPKELIRQNDRDGLDRYRDKFITLASLCETKPAGKFKSTWD